MPPLGADGPDISDLQPPTTSDATAVSNTGLIHMISGVAVWLFFMVLPSRFEVWRRTLKPPELLSLSHKVRAEFHRMPGTIAD